MFNSLSNGVPFRGRHNVTQILNSVATSTIKKTELLLYQKCKESTNLSLQDIVQYYCILLVW